MLAAPSSVDNISYGIGNTLEMEVVSLEEFWRRGNSERETCIYHTSCLVNIQTSHAKFHSLSSKPVDLYKQHKKLAFVILRFSNLWMGKRDMKLACVSISTLICCYISLGTLAFSPIINHAQNHNSQDKTLQNFQNITLQDVRTSSG